MAAVSSVGRATGLEPLELHAESHAASGLYERHASNVFAYCLSKLGRREDAEDAVQTTFLHAVRGLRQGVVPSVEIAWLLGIARNVCLSRFESAGRRGRLELVCDPVDLERSAAPQGRSDELIGIEAALARLPEQQRRAVLLRDWRGLSYEEVATQLGVSLANAESLIFRGRRTLAELLEEKPSTVRRRLAALGNLGSLASAIKTALTGAAAATKLAAAVAVIAASGAGIAAGTGAFTARDETPPVTKPEAGAPVVAATPAPGSADPSTRAKAAAAVQPKRTQRAVPTAAEPRAGTPAGTPAASPPTSFPDAPTTATAPPSATGSAPAPVVKLPAVENVVADPPGTVQSTVHELVPELPVPVPPLPEAVGSLPLPELPPVVETVVESVPPAPVGPITIDPGKLLP